MFYLDYRFKYK